MEMPQIKVHKQMSMVVAARNVPAEVESDVCCGSGIRMISPVTFRTVALMEAALL